MNELYHYGIQGMKWGVRRFQNKDGTRTKEGKLRYLRYRKKNGELTDSAKKVLEDIVAKSNGILSEPERGRESDKFKDDDGNYTLPKGSDIYRMANANEPIDEKRKYAFFTDYDTDEYEYLAKNWDLDIKAFEDWGKYTYTAKKDIRIANGEKVAKYLVDNFGDEELKEEYPRYKKLVETLPVFKQPIVYAWDLKKYLSDEEIDFAQKVYADKERVKRNIGVLTNKYMYRNLTTSSELYSHFAKVGYDAIVDIEDATFAPTDLPIVVINPKNSIEFKNYENR